LGKPADAPAYYLSRWLFLRLLGVVFLVAFGSLWVQIHGLVGANGILPAREMLDAVSDRYSFLHRIWILPTLCWISPSDGFLHVLCAAGVVSSILLIVGIMPTVVLPLLWGLYLSHSVAGQVFLGFQWDTLLLESAFWAFFWAPLGLWPALNGRCLAGRWGPWLIRLLVLKLMFLSGVTKLLSGDAMWRDMTALEVHFETQPIPNGLSWPAHQAPPWVLAASTWIMYVIEIVVPFLVFGPRRLRLTAGVVLILFQAGIAATGNYGFFNLLSAVLCISLFDDEMIRQIAPRRFIKGELPSPASGAAGGWKRLLLLSPVLAISGLVCTREMVRAQDRETLPGAVVTVLDASNAAFLSWSEPTVLRWASSFRTINGYGLFRVMTPQRPEIEVEESNDAIEWRPYVFRWKTGPQDRRPGFVAPHMPRLDWQMWFAALGPRRNAYWLEPFMDRLLEGSDEVTELLASNPFSDKPPRFVRLVLYRYSFTDVETKNATGQYWDRELLGVLASKGLPRSSSERGPDRR
jgi:hypothetical protein